MTTSLSVAHNVDGGNFDDAVIVIFDLETTGLSNSAEVCQIAAAYDSKSYNAYILPSGEMTTDAAAVTGLSIVGGALFLEGTQLDTTPPCAAIKNFIEFLLDVSNKKGVILVAHNGFRFDAPLILRTAQRFGLLKEFMQAVKGFADTLPIFRHILIDRKKQNKRFNQCALANDYLGPAAVEGAHNAIHDVHVLKQLIEKIGLTAEVIKQETKSVSQVIKEQIIVFDEASDR